MMPRTMHMLFVQQETLLDLEISGRLLKFSFFAPSRVFL